jgi:signal transduction histidine kinase
MLKNNKQAQTMIRVVLNSAELLLFLVNDMLDVYMLKNGKLQPIFAKVNFDCLIQEIMQMFQIQARAKGLNFEYELTERVPHSMVMDNRRFK